MLHSGRTWGVSPCLNNDELARKLSDHTWTLCVAFETTRGTIWANDSTGPDGAQEFGVIRRMGDHWRQVETVTVGWCQPDRLRTIIDEADAGEFDHGHDFGPVSSDRLERQHETCPHCA